MRGLPFLVLILVGSAGCLSPGASDEASDQSGAPASNVEQAPARSTAPDAQAGTPAPDLPVGRAFTYRGEFIYNPDTEFTVVVAQKEEKGYLFAAADRSDLLLEVTWGESWWGRRDFELNREGWPSKPFSFPLHDGKTWKFSSMFDATARAAEVPTPSGPEPGFVITASNENAQLRWTYAPSVGYFTSFESTWFGVQYSSLLLVEVSTASAWAWYEGGPSVEQGDPPPVLPDGLPRLPASAGAAPWMVPAGFDEVVASAGGRDGGRAYVQPPASAGDSAWTPEFTQEAETWDVRSFPATEGAWAVGASRASDASWGYLRAVAVRWLDGTV